jgi:DNA-binding NtrC family response regulator
LYVDDEQAIRRAVRTWLERRGHAVYTAGDTAEARSLLTQHRVDGVFIDVWLGAESGLALHEWISEAMPALQSRVAFVTGDLDASEGDENAVRAIGQPVLAKPFDLPQLERLAETWAKGAA